MRRTTQVRGAVAVGAVVTLLGSGIAYADTVTNDVASSADGKVQTITSGGSTTVNFRVLAETAAGDANGCNVTGSSPGTLTVTAPNGVTVDANPALDGNQNTVSVSGCYNATDATPKQFPAAFTSATEGNHNITVDVTGGKGGSSYNEVPASFTLSVGAAQTDCTTGRAAPSAPTIAETNETSKSSNGWYNAASLASTFTVSSGANAEYRIGSGAWTAYSGAVTLPDGEHSVTSRNFLPATTDCPRVDGTSSEATAMNVDKTAPGADPVNVTNGTWRNSALSQVFTFSDTGSGLAPNQGLDTHNRFTVEAATESANADTPTVASKTVSDIAGNSVTRTVSALIDLTKPTSSVQGVTAGAVYATAPTVTCLGSDAESLINPHGSLINSHGSPTGNTTTAGVKTVTCNGATDNAGNLQTVASAAISYTLAPMGTFNTNFDGGALLVVKPNQAIPLKWAFNDGVVNHALLAPTGTTISSVSSNRCSTLAGSDGTEAAVSESVTGASGLQLLPDNSYQMNWKAGSTTGCRALTVKMGLAAGGEVSKTILVEIKK